MYPELFWFESVKWYSEYMPIALKAKKIITISNSSAEYISFYLIINRKEIKVIYNGITNLSKEINSTINLPSEKYIVFLGANDKNKNIDIILKALENEKIQDISLVMIGNNTTVQDIISTSKLKSRVHFMGKLDDDNTSFIIHNAIALVFPSIYEGFGLPPLEAALCGTPSICSNRPAMNEIMYGCALFASPEDADEWISQIEFLRDNPDERKELVKLAQKRAQEFTWEKMSRMLEAVLNDIAE